MALQEVINRLDFMRDQAQAPNKTAGVANILDYGAT